MYDTAIRDARSDPKGASGVGEGLIGTAVGREDQLRKRGVTLPGGVITVLTAWGLCWIGIGADRMGSVIVSSCITPDARSESRRSDGTKGGVPGKEIECLELGMSEAIS